MKKDNLLSITELAKLRKVTSETLRYYDRIGLLEPKYVDPETKYRYYSIRQYEKLGTIKELRELGMSIESIMDYFTDRSLEKSKTILTKYHEKLKQEIRAKRLLEQALNRKLQFINELDPPPPTDVVTERRFDERYMITFEEPAGGPREHAYAFTRLEWYLDETAPILASDRVGVYADDTLLQASDKHILAYPMLLVDKKLIKSPYLRAIPAGLYLSMFYRSGHLELYHKSFEIIKKYMLDNGYSINGHILQTYKIDVTLTSNIDETLMEVQIPVEKKK